MGQELDECLLRDVLGSATVVKDQEHRAEDTRELSTEEPCVLQVGLVHPSLLRRRLRWVLLDTPTAGSWQMG